MLKKYLIICLLIIISCPAAFASADQNKHQIKNREAVYKSLLNGVKSDNFGLRTSAAFMMGELKFKESVIPLLSMLHNEDSESARIVAALSLYKIGDARGIYAVKQAIRFDRSARVSRICELLYQSYLSEKVNQNSDL